MTFLDGLNHKDTGAKLKKLLNDLALKMLEIKTTLR